MSEGSEQQLRSKDEIQAKLDGLQEGNPSERDTARLAQVRALRWVLKESVSL